MCALCKSKLQLTKINRISSTVLKGKEPSIPGPAFFSLLLGMNLNFLMSHKLNNQERRRRRRSQTHVALQKGAPVSEVDGA